MVCSVMRTITSTCTATVHRMYSQYYPSLFIVRQSLLRSRTLCRIEFVPVVLFWWTRACYITYMLASWNVFYDIWHKPQTHMWHPFSRHNWDNVTFPSFTTHPPPIQLCFYLSSMSFTHPNDGYAEKSMEKALYCTYLRTVLASWHKLVFAYSETSVFNSPFSTDPNDQVAILNELKFPKIKMERTS